MSENYERLKEKINGKVGEGNYRFSSFSDYSKSQILSLFKKISLQLGPIYGSGKNNFIKMLEGKDRESIFLEYEGKPIGTLVFKNAPLTDDKKTCSKRGYLEIKSLFLFDQQGRGHVRKLREKLLESIKTMNTPLDGIRVSVDKNQASESLNMFEKVGFKELYEWYGKYKPQSIEAFLYYPLSDSFTYKKRGLPIRKIYFEQIAKGIKTVEGRTGPHFEGYKTGDTLVFISGGKTIEKTIKAVIKYNSIKEYLEQEGITNCLPGIQTLSEAENIYLEIPGYPEKIEKYGMLAFRF